MFSVVNYVCHTEKERDFVSVLFVHKINSERKEEAVGFKLGKMYREGQARDVVDYASDLSNSIPSREANIFSDSQEVSRFMEPGGSLPYSQQPASAPCPEPDESTNPLHTLTPCFLKTHFV
jgi:hypothetical protein